VEQTCKKTLYLAVGKDVKLIFNEDSFLSNIRLSVNKVSELFGNQIIDQDTIFDIEIVALLTMKNHKTYIKIENRKQFLEANSKHMDVSVDREKTKDKKENHDVLSQNYFDFFVDEEQKIKPHNLSLFLGK
jgi:hypothetical protein